MDRSPWSTGLCLGQWTDPYELEHGLLELRSAAVQKAKLLWTSAESFSPKHWSTRASYALRSTFNGLNQCLQMSWNWRGLKFHTEGENCPNAWELSCCYRFTVQGGKTDLKITNVIRLAAVQTTSLWRGPTSFQVCVRSEHICPVGVSVWFH